MIDDPKGILDCYETYGEVGITGVLSAQECAETLTRRKKLILEYCLKNGIELDEKRLHLIFTRVKPIWTIIFDLIDSPVANRSTKTKPVN